jgi:hypothetical protein
MFYIRSPDGSRVLPKKSDDGKYHVEGELVVCSPDTQMEHFVAMRPILDAVRRRSCIIITPMPRYIISGCFDNEQHVSNRKHRFFKEHMQQGLDGVARKLKNYLFNANRRNMRMLDTSYDLRDLANDDIWCVDPVHPIEPVYRRLASGVVKISATLRELENRLDNKRRRTDSMENQQQRARRPRESENSQQGGHRHWGPRPHESEYSREGERADDQQQRRPREAEHSRYGDEDDMFNRLGRGSMRGRGRHYRGGGHGGRGGRDYSEHQDSNRYGGHRY